MAVCCSSNHQFSGEFVSIDARANTIKDIIVFGENCVTSIILRWRRQRTIWSGETTREQKRTTTHVTRQTSGDSKGRKRKSEEKTKMHSYVILIISTAWLHDAASFLVMRGAECRPFLFRSVHKLLNLTTRLYDFRETLPAVLRGQQLLVSQVAASPCASTLYNSGCEGSYLFHYY